jgi:hypothetical protein
LELSKGGPQNVSLTMADRLEYLFCDYDSVREEGVSEWRLPKWDNASFRKTQRMLRDLLNRLKSGLGDKWHNNRLATLAARWVSWLPAFTKMQVWTSDGRFWTKDLDILRYDTYKPTKREKRLTDDLIDGMLWEWTSSREDEAPYDNTRRPAARDFHRIRRADTDRWECKYNVSHFLTPNMVMVDDMVKSDPDAFARERARGLKPLYFLSERTGSVIPNLASSRYEIDRLSSGYQLSISRSWHDLMRDESCFPWYTVGTGRLGPLVELQKFIEEMMEAMIDEDMELAEQEEEEEEGWDSAQERDYSDYDDGYSDEDWTAIG